MRNDLLKYGIGFVAGAIISGLVTWKIVERYYEGVIEEIEKDSSVTIENIYSEVEEGDTQETEIESFGNNLRKEGALVRNKFEKSKVNYNGMFAGVTEELVKQNIFNQKIVIEDEEETDDDFEDVEYEGEISLPEPYVISGEEYGDEFLKHEKLEIQYYVEDDVLCDDKEVTIDDIEGTVGWDALHKLDEDTTVWVRNERLGIDYEICRVDQSYAEVVLGYEVGTPREKHDKKMNRRKKDGEEN